MIKFTLMLVFLFAFHSTLLLSQTTPNISSESNEQSPRFAIHLLDYLAHDYGGAVVHGKVASKSEYAEQKEFIQKIYELAETLPELKENKNTFNKIIKLKSMIENLADAADVGIQAREIQKDLIDLTKINLAPNRWPSLTNGKLLFSQNCVSCHGANGLGDGPDGIKLEPKPANFHNNERMNSISAFHSYNTIRLGVPGTGMPAWSQFSDKEVWDLAFYIMSIRHEQMAKSAQSARAININQITLEEASSLSDNDLKEKFYEKDESTKILALAFLRNKNDDTSSGQFIGIAKNYLNQALIAYKNNSKNNANKFALQAYLNGIEPIEPMIKANNPELVVKIENEMRKVRQIIVSKSENTKQLSEQITLTQNFLTEVEEEIQVKNLSSSVSFFAAFSIILREGFEAVLIILTLLSVIKAFGNKKAALWVHAGWMSALFLGFVAWFLSGSLMKMSGASREMMEAITSSFAVVVLLYFGFWLHRQTEISRWKSFIQEKIQGALDKKNLFGLFTIAFISVFREAFETVLFIRALWFQTNPEGKNAISMGLTSALILIFTFSYIALRYSKKLPIRELFKVSSFLTSILAFILAGKAVHSLQEAGILNASSLPWNMRFDTIGIFPTWQTFGAQLLISAIVFLLIKFNSKNHSISNKTA